MNMTQPDYLHTSLGLHSTHQHEAWDGCPIYGLAQDDAGEAVAFVAVDEDDENGALSFLFDAETAERINEHSDGVLTGCTTYLVSYCGNDVAQKVWNGQLSWREAFTSSSRHAAITLPLDEPRIVTEVHHVPENWLPEGDGTLRSQEAMNREATQR